MGQVARPDLRPHRARHHHGPRGLYGRPRARELSLRAARRSSQRSAESLRAPRDRDRGVRPVHSLVARSDPARVPRLRPHVRAVVRSADVSSVCAVNGGPAGAHQSDGRHVPGAESVRGARRGDGWTARRRPVRVEHVRRGGRDVSGRISSVAGARNADDPDQHRPVELRRGRGRVARGSQAGPPDPPSAVPSRTASWPRSEPCGQGPRGC